MFNKEFLKTLTVLYVEDDEKIRGSLSNIFKKVFAEIIVCTDGEDGINKFSDFTQVKNTKIHLVISDINMPHKNGLEMVEEIRKLDQEIPIIFTTAHGESDYLLESIKFKISYYAIKPINTAELLDNISEICLAEHNKELVKQQSNQLIQYMDIINNITAIFKVNTKGIITQANELLCQISKYTQEELIGMHINELLLSDAIVKTFEDTLALIDPNKPSQSKLKFNSKTNEIFYLNTSIIASNNEYSSEIEGYVYVCIDQTEEEIEKQQTLQRVRKNIMQHRAKESDLLKATKELENQIEKIKASSISSTDTQVIMNSLAKEKQKVITLNQQILHYEAQIVKLTHKKIKVDGHDKAQKLKEMKKKQEHGNEKEKLQSKIIELQSQISQLQARNRQTIID